MHNQLNYWLSQLADLSRLEFPTDKPRPQIITSSLSCSDFQLSQELVKKINSFSEQKGGGNYIVLLAALLIVIHRYTGQDDLVLGVAFDRDDSLEVNSKLLPFRSDLTGNLQLSSLLAKIQSTLRNIASNQNIDLEELNEIFFPANGQRHQLFQLVFVYNRNIVSHQQSNAYDLVIEYHEIGAKLVVNYAHELFEAKTIERFFGHYQTLLQQIVAQPDAAISELPMLTESERRQLLVEWNDTSAQFPDDKCIHQLFEAHVVSTPDAIAVMYENFQLSYAQLNLQANQLAHQLRDFGVKPDTLVAICAERSLNMMVGLLAILKAGCAYVPLNPNNPVDLLATMLADCTPVALLIQPQFEKLFENIKTSFPVINLEAADPKWNGYPTQNIDLTEIELCNAHLAYVIYTSGSTGKPKGVMIEHKGLCSMITDLTKRYQVTPKDRILQFAPIAFDMSVEEIFTALCSGATLVLRNEELITDGKNFWQNCANLGVTVVNLPTLFWQQLVQDEALEISRSIRQIMIGGDAVNSHVLSSWFNSNRYRPKLFNAYGPTEATVNATIQEPALDAPSWQSIGRPIANTRIYILDTDAQLAPIGHVGELYIGGIGVARGYLNQAELTDERFVPDPYSPFENARMYKTGDQARWLADGSIEFLGRNDFQVKIRDFRIELGAIEARLLEHAAIRDAVVLARSDNEGGKRLVAYLVAKDSCWPAIAELRDFLAQKLPLFMVPTAFEFLPAFPTTPNGKLDRKALPEPNLNRDILNTLFQAPRNATEQKLTEIWSIILGIKQIGVGDNFFDLGGHSLLAIKMIVAIERVFNIKLSLGNIYQYPCIEQLASILLAGVENTKFYSLLTIQGQGSRCPLFIVHTALEDLPRYMEKNQPIYFLRYGLAAEVRDRPLQLPALKELASHYIKEMQQLQPNGPYQLIGFSFGGLLAYEMACQLTNSGNKVDFLGIIDTYLSWERHLIPYRKMLQKLFQLSLKQFWTILKNNLNYHLTPEDNDTNFWPQFYTSGSEWVCRQGYTLSKYEHSAILFQATDRDTMFYTVVPPENAWVAIIKDKLKIETVPGTHLEICREPNVKILAEKIKESIYNIAENNLRNIK